MAADETPPYGRSSSRVSRAIQDTSFEQRSVFGHTTAKKSQQKAASDKLVWFSPVRSPLLSPARDKTLPTSKKKFRNSSIFSMQSRPKGSIEAEEPTSPKVSCIGQVRAYKKDKDPFADLGKKKIPMSKPGSMSPARFFTSPGRASKWGALFGSRKDSCATPSSSGYGGDYQSEKLDAWGALGGFLDRYTHDAAESQIFGESRSFAAANRNSSRRQGASAFEKFYDVDVHEDRKGDSRKAIMHAKPNHVENSASPEVSSQEHRLHGKPTASKQRLTYEELPSLHCGPSMKPNMKISVEVVPETWLLRNEESLRANSGSQSSCVPERSTSTSREDLQKLQAEQRCSPISSGSKAQQYNKPEESCTHLKEKSDLTSVDIGLASMDNLSVKPSPLDIDRNTDKQSTYAYEASVTLPSCTSTDVCEGESKGIRSSSDEDGAHGSQLDKDRALDGEKLKAKVDVEKHCTPLGSSELKKRLRRLRRINPDVGKENFGIGIPQQFDRKLPSSVEDEKHLRSIFNRRKSDAFSAQPFSALILVGYDSPVASKHGLIKATHEEELLKEILEVGRLSFHGSGKYFQVLKGDAAFIRSRSATSHRTVITLPRCNSDPCRPSH